MTYYSITTQGSSNSYRPVLLIEETDSLGTKLEDAGLNVVAVGVLAPSYTPSSAKSDEPVITFQLADGNSIDMTYEQVTTYSIWGTTSGLESIHEIWDAIANNAPTAL